MPALSKLRNITNDLVERFEGMTFSYGGCPEWLRSEIDKALEIAYEAGLEKAAEICDRNTGLCVIPRHGTELQKTPCAKFIGDAIRSTKGDKA